MSSFLINYNAKPGIAGRVFFHLVENKSNEYPFAFLATYSTETSNEKKAAHVPRKNALLEYKDRQDLLLELLSTVSRAADTSDFISELAESGELFSPLQFTSDKLQTRSAFGRRGNLKRRNRSTDGTNGRSLLSERQMG